MAKMKVVIVGDASGAVAAFDRARVAAQGFEASMTRTGKLLETTGKNMTRYLTVPIAGVGVAATKMALDFNRQMLMVQTQAGASAVEVKKMTGAVLEMAHHSAEGPQQLAQGLFHLESLGLRGAKALAALKVSSDAAGMGMANMEDVTTALGGAVVTGIKGTESYSKAMGVLNATIGAGNMKMQDLTAALGTGVLPAAKAVGLTLPEVGAALATLTDRGMSADSAATRLRMTFALMEKPTKSAAQGLSELGINTRQLADLMRQGNGQGLLQALELLKAGMEKVGDKTKATQALLQAFGGGRTSAAIQTLIQSLDSGVSAYDKKLAEVNANTGKFAQQVAAYHQSASFKIQQAWNSIQADMIKAGAGLAPIAAQIAKSVAGVVHEFDSLPPGVKKAIGEFAAFTAVVGPALIVTGKLVKMFAAVRAAAITLGILRTVAAQEAVVGSSAAAATAEVGGLRAALLGLTRINPIVIPIIVDYEIHQHQAGIVKAIDSIPGIGYLDRTVGKAGGAIDKYTGMNALRDLIHGSGVAPSSKAGQDTSDRQPGGSRNPVRIPHAAPSVPVPFDPMSLLGTPGAGGGGGDGHKGTSAAAKKAAAEARAVAAAWRQTIKDIDATSAIELSHAKYAADVMKKALTAASNAAKANLDKVTGWVDNVKTKLSSAWGDVSSKILAAFDKQTQAHITAMQATMQKQIESVLGPQYFQGSLTPKEQQLADMQAADTLKGYQDAVQQAQDDLSAAQQANDEKAIASAQKALAAAQRALDEYDLGLAAAKERAQADKDYAAALKQLQDQEQAGEAAYLAQRDADRDQLSKDLESFGAQLANGTTTLDNLNPMLSQFGLTIDDVNTLLNDGSNANSFKGALLEVTSEMQALKLANDMLAAAAAAAASALNSLANAKWGSAPDPWMFPLIPRLDTGGQILQTGLAVVHRGETVMPAGRGGDINVTVNAPNYVGSKNELISVVRDGLVQLARREPQILGGMA